MKKSIWVVVSVACLTCSAMAEQRVGPFATGIVSSGDKSGSAFGGGIKYEWLFIKNLGVDLHAGYLNDGTTGVIPVEIGPVVILPLEPVSLYAGTGAGCFIPTDSAYNPAVGFYALAGIRVPVSDNVELFAEGQYVYAKGEDKTKTTYYRYGWEKTTTRLDFSGVGANLGVLWKF